jgi:hypothetical protein
MKNARTNALLTLGILALAALAACNPITQPEQLNAGAFNADFTNTDGQPVFFTSTNATAHVSGSTYTVDGTQVTSSGTSELNVSGIPMNSSVPYSSSSTDNSDLRVSFHDALSNRDYSGGFNKGSCFVSISQTSPTLQGTFSGTLISRGIPDSIRQVTSASFNATMQ